MSEISGTRTECQGLAWGISHRKILRRVGMCIRARDIVIVIEACGLPLLVSRAQRHHAIVLLQDPHFADNDVDYGVFMIITLPALAIDPQPPSDMHKLPDPEPPDRLHCGLEADSLLHGSANYQLHRNSPLGTVAMLARIVPGVFVRGRGVGGPSNRSTRLRHLWVWRRHDVEEHQCPADAPL